MSKQYTRSEVAAANAKEKTLIIIHDKVYDVHNFLNEHPGGEEILLDHRGKDSSEDFDDVGHSADAFDLMKQYVVGELEESERSNKAPKKAWAANSNKKQGDVKSESASPVFLMAGFAVLLAIIYYVYL